MNHTTSDVLGRAAYLKRSCEILLGQLAEANRMVNGTEQLTPIQEAAVTDANVKQAERAKEHLELASQYLDGWKSALTDALQMEPSWLQP